jgi:hypothetical protein
VSAEIVLSAAELKSVRDGATVLADSSDGKVVNVSTMPYPDDGRFRVALSPADLDLIERDPEGLVCASTDGTTGWTVRVAS